MDEVLEDIKKLDEILKMEEENQNNLQQEFDEFLNYEISDEDEQLEGFESEINIDFENTDVHQLDEITNTYLNVNTVNFHSDINLVKHYLTKEEKKIINSCKDPQLKNLMLLNRVKQIQNRNVLIKLYDSLKECNATIKEIKKKIDDFSSEQNSIGKSILPKLGHPYFKTRDGYSCFHNKDTIRKKQNKEVSIDYLPVLTRWTMEDQIILKRAILFNYRSNRIIALENKLKMWTIMKPVSKGSNAVNKKDLEKIREQLAKLKDNNNDPEVPPLNCKTYISWDIVAAEDLKGRHSQYACEAFWNIYLHPSINKSHWTDVENKLIQKLGEQYKYQNWDAIAEQLDNNRNGFLVCVHYFTKLCDKFKRDPFDPAEDEFLIDAVESCRMGNYIPWTKVSHFFDNRSKLQIYHRYKYGLMFKNGKKGPFSEAEDVLLLVLVHKLGKDFNTISAKYMNERSPVQLSHRYENYLKLSTLNFGNWSVEEDKILLDHVKTHGPKDWSSLLGVLERNRTHLRQRYVILKKWLDKNPNKKIEEIKRKKQHFKQKDDLVTIRAAADYFKNFAEIPSLDRIIAHLQIMDKKLIIKVNKKQKNDLIDAELIDFFQSSYKISLPKTVVSAESIKQSVIIIKMLLSILECKLEIPDQTSLQQNSHLDPVDREILKCLAEDSNISEHKNIEKEHSVVEPTPGPSSSIQHSCLSAKKDEQPVVVIKNIVRIPSNINTVTCVTNKLIMDKVQNTKPVTETVGQTNDKMFKATKIPVIPPHINTLSTCQKIYTKSIPVAIDFMPPNMNTLIGLRSMLITYNSFKSRLLKSSNKSKYSEAVNNSLWSMQQDMLQFNDIVRKEIMQQRDIYEKRFIILFQWPALMSVIEPSESLNLINTKPKQEEKSPRRPGRPRKNLNKISLMRDANRKRFLKSKEVVEGSDSDTEISKILDAVNVKAVKNNPKPFLKIFISQGSTNENAIIEIPNDQLTGAQVNREIVPDKNICAVTYVCEDYGNSSGTSGTLQIDDNKIITRKTVQKKDLNNQKTSSLRCLAVGNKKRPAPDTSVTNKHKIMKPDSYEAKSLSKDIAILDKMLKVELR